MGRNYQIREKQVRDADEDQKEWVCLICGHGFNTFEYSSEMLATMGIVIDSEGYPHPIDPERGGLGLLRCISCNSLDIVSPATAIMVLDAVAPDNSGIDDAEPAGGWIKPKKPE